MYKVIFDPSKKEFEPPVPVITPEYESGIGSYTFSLMYNGSLVIAPTVESNEDVGIFESLHPFIIIATKDSKVTLGLFFLTIHDIELTLSSKGIATFRTTGGLLDVFFFFGPDPTSVAKQYLHLVGFPSLPSLLLLKNGISHPIVYILDGGRL
ncbi:hypothetical protein MRX96_043329 [Rhipicephalus microplus]